MWLIFLKEKGLHLLALESKRRGIVEEILKVKQFALRNIPHNNYNAINVKVVAQELGNCSVL